MTTAISFFLSVYRYRVALMPAQKTGGRFRIFLQSAWDVFINKRKILFYPEGPRDFHAIYKLLLFLGYHITSDPRDSYRMAIQWWLAFDGNPYAPQNRLAEIVGTRRNGCQVLNLQGNDISKNNVNATFAEVFGYSLAVDPRSHVGQCVMKLNWNALHKGKVIDCPAEPVDEDVVYQRLVRNETDDGFVEDIRVPVFRDKIPFVYLKYRAVGDRLVDRLHTNTKAITAETDDVLSEAEQTDICRFCRKMGLDYCEVDVLRDRENGRIYIVDANNTPSGPPSPISDDDGRIAVIRLAKAFQETFGGKHAC
ncbi:hypothetical protein [uncultured Desulfosarcina sp.]|uniref:hypothetical protein n=1 Tax=uncultured Desulfosarcina sp. TaxID=218289 RepID=UPI0029C878EE|nr:hypothetical protein [uncultured Desulfosarcina sp.]